MITAVLDINVIISALIVARGNPYQVWMAWQAGAFGVMISEGMITEPIEKLRMPKIAEKYGIAESDVVAVVAVLRVQGRVVSVSPAEIREITVDPENDRVLAKGRIGEPSIS